MSKRLLILIALVALPAAGAMAQPMNPNAHPALKACKGDIARFCSNVSPGGGRIKECMKAHVHELSEPCKEALFQAWLKQ
jgi:hypothetical protein